LPTFEVHGVAGGYAGPGLKAIVPGRAEVFASCRLVPDQTPERIRRLVTSFVKKHAPDVEVHAEGGSLPYRGVTTGPLADAIREAMRFGFGRKPVFIRDGGTIGAVTTMEKVLRCPVLFLGISLPEHGYHAPNENFDWRQAEGGMAAFADYFRRVADLGKPTSKKSRI
jgi:acetylornithine deacetylase/succinyl-diaminopimelate desuccinylase-like protein